LKFIAGSSVKLLIIDDSAVVYHRFIELLGGVESITALAVARNIEESQQKILALQPDTLLIDPHFSDPMFRQALSKLRSQLPLSKIYIFSNCYDYKHIMLSLGVDGFFDKSLEFELLLRQLKQDIEYAKQF
jgi:DNA-binding NarL/FixJ family response regulator